MNEWPTGRCGTLILANGSGEWSARTTAPPASISKLSVFAFLVQVVIRSPFSAGNVNNALSSPISA